MFQTFRLGRIFGTDVFWHWTMWPLLLYLLFGALLAGGWNAIATTLVLFLTLFFSVLVHELGHALAAQSVNIKTRDIILLPIGGVARFDTVTLPARKELWIASAGPLANLVLALLIYGSALLIGTEIDVHNWPATTASSQLIQINLILGLSNLLPALPLDGGRIMRAVLAIRKGDMAGTILAARVSRWVGFAMMITAPFLSWWLLLLGLFIVVGSIKEMFTARFKSIFDERMRGTTTSGNPWTTTSSEYSFDQPVGRSTKSSAANTIDAVEVKQL